MTVWVVTCEQHYANHFSIVGVFANEQEAEEVANSDSDYQVEEYEVKACIE